MCLNCASLGLDANGISMGEEPPAKKCNIIDSVLEEQIEVQSNEFFNIFDKLKSFNKRDDCLDILSANNQFVPESFIEVMTY